MFLSDPPASDLAEALYDEAWRGKLAARYGSEPQITYYDSQVTVDPSSIIVG